MVTIMKIAFIFFLTLLASCSILERKNGIIVKSVDSTGVDGSSREFCSDFDLSIQEAQSFFERAELISISQLHENYSFLPCYVRGSALQKNKVCSWEIRAGGTGELTCGEYVQMYGCTTCDDILK